MKSSFFLFIFLVLTIFSVNDANSRGPAVEPSAGISIDNEPVVTPSKNTGSDFKDNTRTISSEKKKRIDSNPTTLPPAKNQSEPNETAPSIFVFFALITILPLISWHLAVSSSHKENKNLKDSKGKDDEDKDPTDRDFNFPKAS